AETRASEENFRPDDAAEPDCGEMGESGDCCDRRTRHCRSLEERGKVRRRYRAGGEGFGRQRLSDLLHLFSGRYPAGSIDVGILLAEWTGIGILTAICWALLADNEKRVREPSHSPDGHLSRTAQQRS